MTNEAIESILDDIRTELESARENYPAMHSYHEGIAIIKEEFDEVWDEIKMKNPNVQYIREEVIQLASSSARFAYDLC